VVAVIAVPEASLPGILQAVGDLIVVQMHEAGGQTGRQSPVNRTVKWAVKWAVKRAVSRAVNRTVKWTVKRAVNSAGITARIASAFGKLQAEPHVGVNSFFASSA
jgi:hypothetical protein